MVSRHVARQVQFNARRYNLNGGATKCGLAPLNVPVEFPLVRFAGFDRDRTDSHGSRSG